MRNLLIIGAGNIINTRHLPALKRHGDRFRITGILDIHGDRAARTAAAFQIPYHAVYRSSLPDLPWVREAEAVIVGTPPKTHAAMIRAALQSGKHVLTEKPFVTDLSEGTELITMARRKNLILAVNHNFQFSHAFSQLQTLIDCGALGKIRSLSCSQITNDSRRLPVWADDLPMGLFYDETPHVFYLMRRFGGNIVIDHAYRVASMQKVNTPQILNVDLHAGVIPATITINFESPVCEWYFTVFGTKQFAAVDMFRDILIVLPNDGQHLMKEVFRTSALATWQHWRGVVSNGVQYLRHNLFYGIDRVHARFDDAVSGNPDAIAGISAADGLDVNRAQWDVIGNIG